MEAFIRVQVSHQTVKRAGRVVNTHEFVGVENEQPVGVDDQVLIRCAFQHRGVGLHRPLGITFSR